MLAYFSMEEGEGSRANDALGLQRYATLAGLAKCAPAHRDPRVVVRASVVGSRRPVRHSEELPAAARPSGRPGQTAHGEMAPATALPYTRLAAA